MEIANDHQSAHQTADGTKDQPLGEGDAGGVGGDHHREGVDGGESGAHGGGEEDGTHADDGVIAERQKDGHQYGVEGDCLFLQPAGGAPQRHDDANQRHEHEFVAPGLARQRHQPGAEGAGLVDDADEPAQYQDEDDDVSPLYGALDHADRHIGETLGGLRQPLIGAGNGDGLADGAAGELFHPDIDIEFFKFGLGGGHPAYFPLRAIDHQSVVGRVIGELGIGPCRNDPGQGNGQQHNKKQNGKGSGKLSAWLGIRLGTHKMLLDKAGSGSAEYRGDRVPSSLGRSAQIYW